ncbi:MAG: DUF4332 domain-containing protein [Myxococcales bacterium]|nr:DUF4332 domain-containing protein [Myxococcales bacterium]MCB9733816.1 DUF4332 domain-containing protein [Deltaproteobacteria bacterium]
MPRRSLLRSVLFGLALAVFVGGAAQASHYRLPIKDRPIVNADELRALAGQGIGTTLALFQRTAKLADRKELAAKSGIPMERLTELACQVDLLRVIGVGPSMMRLLQLAGVRHAGDLAAAGADDLLTRLEAANAAQKVADVLPRVEIVADWIGKAKALPSLLEGVQ